MFLLSDDNQLSLGGLLTYAHLYWRIAYRESRGKWQRLSQLGCAEEIFDGLRRHPREIQAAVPATVTFRKETRCCTITLDEVRTILLGTSSEPDRREEFEDAFESFSLIKEVDQVTTRFVRTSMFSRWRRQSSLCLADAYPKEPLKWVAAFGMTAETPVPFLGALVCFRLERKLWLGLTDEPANAEEHSEVLRRLRDDAEFPRSAWRRFRRFDQEARLSWLRPRLVAPKEQPQKKESTGASPSQEASSAPPVRSRRVRSMIHERTPRIAKALPRIQRWIRAGDMEKAARALVRADPDCRLRAEDQIQREAEFLRVVDASTKFKAKDCPKGITPRQAMILAALVGWAGDRPCSWQSPVDGDDLLTWGLSHYVGYKKALLGERKEDLVPALRALEIEGLFFQVQHRLFQNPVYYCSYDIGFLNEIFDGAKHVSFWAHLANDNDQEYGRTWRATGVCAGQGSQSGDSRWGPCLGTSCSWFEAGSDHCNWSLNFNTTLVEQRRADVSRNSGTPDGFQ